MIISLLLGALAGYLGSLIMKTGDRPIWQYLVFGILGGFVAGFLPFTGILGYAADVAGACLVIYLADKFLK